jgi:Flp pilus assembly protein TadD
LASRGVAGGAETAAGEGGVGGPTPPKEFGAALDEAVAAARSGDRATAVSLLTQLTEAYPAEPAVLYNLGLTYEFDADGNRYKSKTLFTAAANYTRVLELDPSFGPARYNLAVVWHRLGYLEEAARHYRLAAQLGGDVARRATYNLALVLKEEGRSAEAEALLENDKGSFDDAARVRLMALLAEDQGDTARALALWKRALALDNSAPFNTLAARHIQTLRGY